MKNDDVIRVGDTIQIVSPLIITRIGYEYTYEMACKEVAEAHTEDVNELLRKTGFKWGASGGNRVWEKAEQKIIGAIAYNLVRKKIMSGNERKIYTKLCEELRGVETRVIGKRMAKTGTYFPPYSGGGYEDGYEPGGLNKEATHVILQLEEYNDISVYGIEIELCNVIKIK